MWLAWCICWLMGTAMVTQSGKKKNVSKNRLCKGWQRETPGNVCYLHCTVTHRRQADVVGSQSQNLFQSTISSLRGKHSWLWAPLHLSKSDERDNCLLYTLCNDADGRCAVCVCVCVLKILCGCYFTFTTTKMFFFFQKCEWMIQSCDF